MALLKSSNEIIPHDDPLWGEHVKSYQSNKKSLQWSNPEKPKYITHQMMIAKDSIYNPLTQKYNDRVYNQNLHLSEQKTLKRSLSQYHDNNLRYEQTFNIINLKDRLKGFEDHPDYPKVQQIKSKQSKDNSRINYNIVSNLSLSKHNSLPPEKRPKITDETEKIKQNKINSFIYKDYDIISNQYKELHDVKSALDFQINQLNASKNFQNRKGYDFISGKNYNKEDQETYDFISNKHKRILSKPPLYNIVNNSVLDVNKVDAIDLVEKNRILRYKVKGISDDYYRSQEIEKDNKYNKCIKNRQNYLRYEKLDKRGYDAITHERNYNYYKRKFQFKNNYSDWEFLRNNVSNNETFSHKPIYRPPYDGSELDENLDQYHIKRKEFLKSLPKIENEKSFERSRHISKINKKGFDNIKVDLPRSSSVNKLSIDKEEWFRKK